MKLVCWRRRPVNGSCTLLPKGRADSSAAVSSSYCSSLALKRRLCFLYLLVIPILAVPRLIISFLFPLKNSGLKSPANFKPRTCPPPTYPLLSNHLSSPAKICLTTFSDEVAGAVYHKLVRWRNFDNVLSTTWANKIRYVQQHGYRLYNESKRSLDRSRPPSWSKIRAVQRLLREEDCEWVFYLDADTVIMNSTIAIESFLPDSYDMLITKQKGGWNAGAWIIRSSDWSRQFLDAWWNMTSFVRPMGLAVSGDNDALKYYLTNHSEIFASHVLTVPRCYFNSVATWRNEGEEPEAALERNRLRVRTSNSDYQIYHQGDFIAHAAGVDDKMKATIELLKDAQ
jgi:galactosyl transferase GMA12/MNN10 family